MPRSQRAVLIGGFALVVAVGLGNALLISTREPDFRGVLAEAVGTSLPFEARLSGGFLPSTAQTKRSADSSPNILSPDARIAIAQLEKRAAADPTPNTRAAVGVAYLVQGDVDRAIGMLQGAAAQRNDASVWSDLAAAYLAKADSATGRRVEYLSRALEAAAQSLRISPSNEALFNRSLALDKLSPFAGNTNPWAEYLTRERDPHWLDTAKRHAGDDVPRVDARQEWEIRRRSLRQQLANLDKAYTAQTVRLFPEASLEFFNQLLVEWAKARVAGNSDAATSVIAQAQVLADALRTVTGDRLPLEETTLLPTARRALADAHLAYADGLRRYSATDYEGATRFLTNARAGFAESKSAYLFWVDVQTGSILSRQGSLETADERLTVVETLARARHDDRLLGRVLWERGSVHMKRWRLIEALGAAREAASCFERAGQRENALALYSFLAALLRSLGEEHESWQHIGKTLEHVNSLRSPTRRYVVLYNAMLFAARQQLLEAALLFQDAAVREGTRGTVDAVVVDAITQRAGLHLRRGDPESATRDMKSATDGIQKLPDGATKDFLAAELDIVGGQLGRSVGDVSSVERLQRAIAFFDRVEPARVPSLYLQLARIQLADGSLAVAEETLRSGIDALERQQSSIGDEALKISYFDDSWDLFQDLITLQVVDRHDSEKAFEYAERSRARLLGAGARDAGQQPLRSIAEVQLQLPSSVTLVYYATLPDRLIIWVVTSTSSRFVERHIASSELARLVSEYRAAIIERRSSPAGARLHDILISPAGNDVSHGGTVVFAPDGDLQQLPFAALRDPATRRYVIEDNAVVVTPSAGIFAAGRSHARELSRGHPASALLVGNPETGAARLPGAETEVLEAAQFYPQHEILTGTSATKDRFIKEAPEFNVVHFGGHGLVNAEYPLLSRLVFAGSGDSGGESLFAHEISKLTLPRTRVVVLAACSTAGGALARGEGVVSVARPFLGAGVPVVVASQWDVDDASTHRLLLEFHRALSQQFDPAAALRAAQLKLLRSDDDALTSPAAWGAFTALGTIAQ